MSDHRLFDFPPVADLPVRGPSGVTGPGNSDNATRKGSSGASIRLRAEVIFLGMHNNGTANDRLGAVNRKQRIAPLHMNAP
jgi:hypothetical protein